MFVQDHTYYTDAFLDACLLNFERIELTAKPFTNIKDEDLEESPVPLNKDHPFPIDFELTPRNA
ncbi:uncharacterized protein Eint_010975 [Encephalitozoon intestinalis ATCC 50506]|uniref:Uncharacterized protein n=1 Tax=Encephalitozoon intestinalis (strain ATCC 50506) TaxID=876142 RepID=W8PGL4_ENCIT|nr:uncharacterized protein Eint_010975 [Encephalitozoon intestinalis ATCC 50506]AHL30071.1 hypothetical protein Eint_010975 [Encephalitozoon intestinalis ATCC 50506]UTX44596.1 hypothetical protein GPK93_01g01060 [Encephalitozoon intestinalis]